MVSIGVLPDDVLLAIFDLYLDEAWIEAWQLLVHVCRRWRSVIFESPRRLKLGLVCRTKTPARDTLDVWPALPLVILGTARLTENVDNIIAALERSDWVVEINLFDIDSSSLENIFVAMRVPFPGLADLNLRSYDETVPIVPESFLGESAPNLRTLSLERIPFPGLPKLLLSTTLLVTLRLIRIPHSGFFSPEALSTLTSLESLRLEFESPRSHPDRASRHPPPPIRSVLPFLKDFEFKGVTEYLDDLVACIDAPQLNRLHITFFNQIIFDTPQFIQFISRTPTLKALEKAWVNFEGDAAIVDLSSHITTSFEPPLRVRISCKELDWQLSSLEQFFTSCLPPLSTLKELTIWGCWWRHWQNNIENMLWLELLHPFSAVTNFHLSKEFGELISPALQEAVAEERSTEVLPTLQNIFLSSFQPPGPFPKGIQQFIAARQVTSHPVAASYI